MYIDFITFTVFLIIISIIIKKIIKTLTQSCIQLQIDYAQRKSTQTSEETVSNEVEDQIQQLTHKYNRYSWIKAILLFPLLFGGYSAFCIFEKKIDSLGVETPPILGGLTLLLLFSLTFIIKLKIFENKENEYVFLNQSQGASYTSIFRLIIILSCMVAPSCSLLGNLKNLSDNIMKETKEITRSNEASKSDWSIDYYLLTSLDLDPQAQAFYDRYIGRGSATTVLHTLPSDSEKKLKFFLTKTYPIRDQDQSREAIHQEIRQDLSTLNQSKICLKNIHRFQLNSAQTRLLEHPDHSFPFESTLIFEPTELKNCAPTPIQNNLITLLTCFVLVLFIIFGFRQTLICRRLILTHIKYEQAR